ncbi:MAG TPA: hypothetical protein VGE52_14030, partial [Pirellulales bacterium]
AMSTLLVLVVGFAFLLACGYFFLVLPAQQSFRALADSNKPIPAATAEAERVKIDFNEPEFEEKDVDPAALPDDPQRLPAWTAMRLAHKLLLSAPTTNADEIVAKIETLGRLGQAQSLAKDGYGASQSFDAALAITRKLPASDVQRSAFAFIAARLASGVRGMQAIRVAQEIDEASARTTALLDVVARLASEGQLGDAKLAASSLESPLDVAWAWQKIAQTQAERNLVLGARQTLKQAIDAVARETDKAKTAESRILVGLALVQATLGNKKGALETIDPITFLPDRVAVLLAVAEAEGKTRRNDALVTLRTAEMQATQIAEPLHRIDPDLQIARLYETLGDAAKSGEVADRSLASLKLVSDEEPEDLLVRTVCFNQIAALYAKLRRPEDAQQAWAEARSSAARLPTPDEQALALADLVDAQITEAAPAEEVALTIAEIDGRLSSATTAGDSGWQTEILTRLAALAITRNDLAAAEARLAGASQAAEGIADVVIRAERLRPLVALVVRLRGWDAGQARTQAESKPFVVASGLFGAAEGALEKLNATGSSGASSDLPIAAPVGEAPGEAAPTE